jgi:hypothetical protein
MNLLNCCARGQDLILRPCLRGRIVDQTADHLPQRLMLGAGVAFPQKILELNRCGFTPGRFFHIVEDKNMAGSTT